MNNGSDYDFIIIGSGAGGGTLAYRLAPSGKKILLIERGPYVRREKDNWNSRAVNAEGKYNTKELWRNADGTELHPHTNYYVGGNTKFYGAALFRLREQDFGEIKHYGGTSPAWPISYNELEPYYTEAEQIYHVHGAIGEDPTEPRRSGAFPYPAISHEPRIQQLSDDFALHGLKPFHTPLGVMLDEKNPQKSPCIRCNTCDGFPCLVNAKADAHICCVVPALRHDNVTLLTDTKVTRLETDGSGREVTAVHVERNGAKESYSGKFVIVSGGAINSAALLLRSANDKHPNGLANSSDVVGRHYMCHNNSALLALSKRPNPTSFQKTLGVNDYYFRSKDWDYPLGHIQMLGKSDLETLRSGAPSFAPGMALDVMAKHSIDFWLTSEDLPDPNNRVMVDEKGDISLHCAENNLEGHNRLVAKLKGMLGEIGCDSHLVPCNFYLGKKIPIAGTAHQCGTVRFGRDPKSSVLDVNCKAHDLDNLYVVDSSFFVSSNAVNPSLTIMANAMRVGDHILERLK